MLKLILEHGYENVMNDYIKFEKEARDQEDAYFSKKGWLKK